MIQKYIITHDGKFHMDEILGCTLLLRLYPNAEIIRTRETAEISKIIEENSHIAVLDVHGIYDHSQRLYDHHQRSFNETFSNKHSTKLSSSGLIFKHYGKNIISTYIKNIDDFILNFLYEKIYNEYFEYVDAIDNGIDTGAVFKIRSLPSIINNFNIDNKKYDEQRIAFMEAQKFVENDFDRYMQSKIRQVQRIQDIIGLIENTDRIERILYVFEIKDCTGLVREIEGDYDRSFYYVINRSDEERYHCYAVPKNLLGFESKLPFPEEWRGLREKDLQKVCGYDDAVFVHSTGFLAITRTLETALQMCRESLNKKFGDYNF